jgi:hypothetical protein
MLLVLVTSLIAVPAHRMSWILQHTKVAWVWAWAVMTLPSHLSFLQVAMVRVASASISPTLTMAASARSTQAEAQATLQCRQASLAPVQVPQATHQRRPCTRPPRQASAARALVRRHLVMLLPALSTHLHRRATRRPRLPMVRPHRHHTRQLLPATRRLRQVTPPRRQVTALRRRLTVVRPLHTIARPHLPTAQRRQHTARQARSLVQGMTGALLLHRRRQRTVLPVRSTPQRAPQATQRTHRRRPSSPPLLRARQHHIRHHRLSGRRPALHTRLRKSISHSCKLRARRQQLTCTRSPKQ